MTDKSTEAGTAHEPGSAAAEPGREQVVIKDKRKIDTSGKPRTADTSGEQATVTNEQPEPAMGQPGGTGSTSGKGESGAAGTSGDAGKSTDTAKEEATKDADEASEAAVTGEVVAEAGKPVLGAELESLRSESDERLRDLQRVSAEYANYRKRVERDRGLVTEQATGSVVSALLPILDDLDRAKEHGDLTGPFAAMAEQLNSALAKFGLAGFGEPGDAFDPTRHEAVAHQTSADVTEPTCVAIMRRGYLLGDRLLRAALVAVADPQ